MYPCSYNVYARIFQNTAQSIDFIPNQPVIKPVVDMSGVYSAANEVGTLFSPNGSINAAARINGNMNAFANRNFKMEETFSNLEKAINKLSGNQPNNYFNVTVDGAESPEAFANRMLKQLDLEMRTG